MVKEVSNFSEFVRRIDPALQRKSAIVSQRTVVGDAIRDQFVKKIDCEFRKAKQVELKGMKALLAKVFGKLK